MILSQVAGVTKSLSSHGAKCEEHKKNSLVVIADLCTLRKEKVVDYVREFKLIETLSQIEREKNNNSGDVTLDLANKGLRAFIPVPGIRIASELVSSTARRYVQGETDLVKGSISSIADVAEKEVKREILSEVISETSELAANLLGMGVSAFALANAPIIAASALLGGGAVLAVNSEMRQSCWDFIKNTASGALDILGQGYSKIVNRENTNELILKSYSLYSNKRAKLIHLDKTKKETEVEHKNAIDRLRSYRSKLKTNEGEFEKRRKSGLAYFVYHINQPGFFHNLLTSLFCRIWSRFKTEKAVQDNLKATISTIKRAIQYESSSLTRLSSEINSLAKKIFSCSRSMVDREQDYLKTLPLN